MTSKTNFINYFLLAFTLAFISSDLTAGTLDFKDKKKDKEKKEWYQKLKRIHVDYLQNREKVHHLVVKNYINLYRV